MSSRDEILARIRAAQGRKGHEPTEAELAQVRAAIAQRPLGPTPAAAASGDIVLRFKGECDRVGTTHGEVASASDVPGEVARYLQAQGLAPRVVAWPALARLGWSAAGITVDDRPARDGDAVGVTDCFCAIAETGTLLLLSAPDTPKLTALLPDTHVAIVSRARLVRTMEDAFALMRAERGDPPRATWFVSGPSRTADIEQTIVIGAHGPYRVHVVLIP